MELVYLWVEEYKNIHKQGFNFSPRFICNYDGTNLTIKDNVDENGNKQYIENFFGDNINVTAIVGKNGSGKSSVLTSLIYLFTKSELSDNNKCNAMAIYIDEDDNYYKKIIGKTSLKIKNITKTTLNDESTNNIYSIYYNYTMDTLFKIDLNGNIANLFTPHYEDSPLLMQPNKSNEMIDINNIEFEAGHNMLQLLINENIDFQQIKNFFVPTKVKLSFKNITLYQSNKLFGNDNTIKKEIEGMSDSFFPDHDNSISNLNRKELVIFTQFYIIIETKMLNSQMLTYEKDFMANITKFPSESSLDKLLEIISDSSFDSLYNSNLRYQIPKIKQSFVFLDYLNSQSNDFKIDDELVIKDNTKLLGSLAPWIDCSFEDEHNKTFFDLSYGQKFLIKFVYNILNHIYFLKSFNKYTHIILMLDEVEIGLHPQWQKEYISLLIDILRAYKERFNFHIIASSHSPFLVSDLPKENVIFLDTFDKEETEKKYPKLVYTKDLEDGDCINVSEHIDINPFGANIHTLLSDGFFMEGGLMGEFAKTKIESIKDFYEKVNNSDNPKKEYFTEYQENIKKFQDIQRIIGEPFLKTIIGNYLDELHLIFSDDKTLIDKELQEIEARKKYLEELKNVKN